MAWMRIRFPESRMTSLRIGIAGMCVVLASSGCTEQPRKSPPTEQEIHSSDSGDPSGTPGRHPYRCANDRELLVDFKNKGLTIELRREGSMTPVVLTAPAQGLQYVGDTMSVTFLPDGLEMEEHDKPAVRCSKATRQ